MKTQRLLALVRTERRRLVERRTDERLVDATHALVLVQADRIAELEKELAYIMLTLRYKPNSLRLVGRKKVL